MNRREFLNVLAAAWIQFQVHDWFVHAKGAWTHTHDIPVDAGDSWHERPMRVPKTPADVTAHDTIHFGAMTASPDWRFVRDGLEVRVAGNPRLRASSRYRAAIKSKSCRF